MLLSQADLQKMLRTDFLLRRTLRTGWVGFAYLGLISGAYPLSRLGANSHKCQRSLDSVEKFCHFLLRDLPKLDIIVNNACQVTLEKMR